MKAIELLKQFVSNSSLAENSYIASFTGIETMGELKEELEAAFGGGYDVVKNFQSIEDFKQGDYIAFWSDSEFPRDIMPDIILVKDEGKCVFLYRIDD